MAWIAASPMHAVAFAQAEVAWRDAERLKALGTELPITSADRCEDTVSAKVDDLHDFPVTDDDVRRGRSTRRGIILSGVAVAGLLGALPLRHVFAPGAELLETRQGEVRNVRLEDGSTVHINTHSLVEVAFTRDRRFLRLLRGEATFDVAHNAARPFEVEAGNSITRAIGTRFTIHRLADEGAEGAQLTVTQGLVSVRDTQGQYAQVAAGHGATMRSGSITPRKLDSLEIARRTSWQDGMLVLDGLTIGEAVAQFNRYRQAPLKVTNADVAAVRVGGRFGLDESDTFLEALRTGFGVRVTHEPDGSVEIG